MTPDDVERRVSRYRTLAALLESRFRLPGTAVRFGWDAVLGLIPGFGDIAGGLLSAYGVWTGWRVGAPGAVLIRMVLNIMVDVVAGLVPLAGDLFDVAWRSNTRNVTLIERWHAEPRAVHRESLGLVLGLTTLLVALLAAALWVSVWLFRLLFVWPR